MSLVGIDVVILGGAMLAVGFAVLFFLSFFAPRVDREYSQPGTIFRPYNDWRMLYTFLHPFAVALALLYLHRQLGPLGISIERIAIFAYVIGPLPGIAMTYASFRISFLMALSWWLMAAAQFLTAVQLINRKMLQ
jgi:hypothetical protein